MSFKDIFCTLQMNKPHNSWEDITLESYKLIFVLFPLILSEMKAFIGFGFAVSRLRLALDTPLLCMASVCLDEKEKGRIVSVCDTHVTVQLLKNKLCSVCC